MAARGKPPKKSDSDKAKAQSYRHPEADSPLRPEIGTQPKFKKKKPPVTYRYDSSLSPALDWDGQNGTRDLGDFLLGCIKHAVRLPAPVIRD
jgi:adenine-specific DNA-methyltransferase